MKVPTKEEIRAANERPETDIDNSEFLNEVFEVLPPSVHAKTGEVGAAYVAFGIALGLGVGEARLLEEREACCKDVCRECSFGDVPQRDPERKYFYHIYQFSGSANQSVGCPASYIRERAFKAENQ